MHQNFAFRTIPNLPPELSTPLPRMIRQSDHRRHETKSLTIMLGIAVIVFLWINIYAARQVYRRSVLRQQGVEVALGEIIEIKEHGRQTDVVSYTFIANGKTVFGEAGMPRKLKESLLESKSIVIRYLPSNPAINHPAAWEYPYVDEPLWFEIFVWLLYASVALIPICFLYKYYRERQLLTWGKPVVGVVTKCSSDRRMFRLKYEFNTGTGMTVNGRGWSFLPKAIGEDVLILCMQRKPRRNHLYPIPEYIVEAGIQVGHI